MSFINHLKAEESKAISSKLVTNLSLEVASLKKQVEE